MAKHDGTITGITKHQNPMLWSGQHEMAILNKQPYFLPLMSFKLQYLLTIY
jgi:hypothetical protein